jgi:N-acetylgalactosamine kinase
MKRNNIDCIMLCAGKGTRMQSKDTHKVCFDIAGKPAVIQAMQRYEKAGIENYTIVVGPMAETNRGSVSNSV